ncbi:hypothetical protein NE237_020289 [Protea cynaroides]|uniref:RING-type domain-containing protein n=1 Tax=Protea cynaroides TaxID=273540 RepID=A0A9Q0K1I2_9MAGN|nr:hypothetical protein NE237_020289 [Protea cynaroides]
MVSDSIVNGPAPAILKDFAKKKRSNRTAKLKQCKLDARREQWLSQVKNKGCKEESNGEGVSPPPYLRQNDERKRSLNKLETRTRGEENERSSFRDSDLESLENSPSGSILGANDSRKDRPGSSSGSSRSSSSGGCYSGSVSEEEEDDGCLDDWEAVADALAADDKRHQPNSKPPAEPKTPVGLTDSHEPPSKTYGAESLKPECHGTNSRVAANSLAWSPDDACRPQSLPNLSKLHSFTMNTEGHCGRGAVIWACRSIISPPSSCPICFEDLDLTDSSFLPCSCGFRLCLFCHKRILEADGRCPGCRKQYDPSIGDMGVNGVVLPIRLARSCSMVFLSVLLLSCINSVSDWFKDSFSFLGKFVKELMLLRHDGHGSGWKVYETGRSIKYRVNL